MEPPSMEPPKYVQQHRNVFTKPREKPIAVAILALTSPVPGRAEYSDEAVMEYAKIATDICDKRPSHEGIMTLHGLRLLELERICKSRGLTLPISSQRVLTKAKTFGPIVQISRTHGFDL